MCWVNLVEVVHLCQRVEELGPLVLVATLDGQVRVGPWREGVSPVLARMGTSKADAAYCISLL